MTENVFSDLTKHFVNECINECKKQENQDTLQLFVVDPLVSYIIRKLQPYIVGTAVFFTLVITLIILILVIVMKKK